METQSLPDVSHAAEKLAATAVVGRHRRAMLEKTAQGAPQYWEWLKKHPEVLGPLIGAGAGGLFGGASSLFQDEDERTPFRNMLTGGLAGGLLGLGGGLAYKHKPDWVRDWLGLPGADDGGAPPPDTEPGDGGEAVEDTGADFGDLRDPGKLEEYLEKNPEEASKFLDWLSRPAKGRPGPREVGWGEWLFGPGYGRPEFEVPEPLVDKITPEQLESLEQHFAGPLERAYEENAPAVVGSFARTIPPVAAAHGAARGARGLLNRRSDVADLAAEGAEDLRRGAAERISSISRSSGRMRPSHAVNVQNLLEQVNEAIDQGNYTEAANLENQLRAAIQDIETIAPDEAAELERLRRVAAQTTGGSNLRSELLDNYRQRTGRSLWKPWTWRNQGPMHVRSRPLRQMPETAQRPGRGSVESLLQTGREARGRVPQPTAPTTRGRIGRGLLYTGMYAGLPLLVHHLRGQDYKYDPKSWDRARQDMLSGPKPGGFFSSLGKRLQ